MKYLKFRAVDVSQTQFTAYLCENDMFAEKPKILQNYIKGNIPRLYRIFRNMLISEIDCRGPALDVGSGWGILYPIYKRFFNAMLPCHVAELFCYDMEYEGDVIPCVTFECEKDELPYKDSSFGVILFFDVLEHLIVDPVYVILELNRVLRKGGHLLINTPNASAAYRIFKILSGQSPATENEIRPSSIYQRHNREWTPDEVCRLMECCGFGNCLVTTNEDMISPVETEFLCFAKQKGILKKSENYFGPDIFCAAEKIEDMSPKIDMPKDRRWPEWLYTSLDIYRKRPEIFPINAENPEIRLMEDGCETS